VSELFDAFQPWEQRREDRIYGVVVGVVTNNQDPDGLGRVKVKFPWLSSENESGWARVAMPMTGAEMGVFFLPEVDDEVLLAFEQGDANAPYVVGSLWTGKAKPPAANADGKNPIRVIKSRSGHVVRLDDTEGAEKIEIIDKTGSNSIVVDSAANTVTIKAQADITVESSGGKLVLKGTGVEITSSADVKIEATGSAQLTATGTTTIKGATVNIN
jgi:uncharacterized protein involved in type VI secretion and phage assembly